MTTMPPVPPARLLARFTPGGVPEVFVGVTDSGREVRVRWRMARGEPWRCDACGPMATADCLHVFAAALLLAEEFLGLSRIPSLVPEGPLQT